MTSEQAKVAREDRVDVAVVGAGFAGLYMLHKLRELGLKSQVIERGSDVGGTWYWNRYPGARCDAVSSFYSYSFSPELEQDWTWSEKYATQPEILSYLRHVADRFDLRRDIWFDTTVTGAHYDAASDTWTISTDRGDRLEARYCVMATGCLSVGRIPDLPGLRETRLPVYHTGTWPREGVDFTGKRVAVVGTGSSGIQLIPEIARQAAEMTVFQRTANFSVPARNAPLNKEKDQAFKQEVGDLRKRWRVGALVGAGEELKHDSTFMNPTLAVDLEDDERRQAFEERWRNGGAYFAGTFADLMTDMRANAAAADFVHGKIREIVDNEATANSLCPTDYPFGAKRLCVDTNYYATFNRPHVSLVDLRDDPIERVSDGGLVCRSGERPFDALVFATGFDAMVGALLKMDIRGKDGVPLAQTWAVGPVNYLGLMVAGFPNLFLITGPGSPSVLGNVVGHIEQHVEFIADLLTDSRRKDIGRIEVNAAAQEAWVQRVNEAAAATLYLKANSWYLGANVPGRPRVFMPYVGGIGLYRQICDEVAANNYQGFERQPVSAAAGSRRDNVSA